jgi:fumarate reductase flavoprotein subunit
MTETGAHQTDVIVVGGGGSGLAAAIEAARLGRSVVLLEKNPDLGGTTGRSVGSITSSCTSFQAEAGIFDTPREHFDDMALFARAVGLDPDTKDNLELRRILVEHAPDTLDWLMDMGVVFFGPMPEPPHRVPRMHNILPNSRSYIYHMARRARRLGVDIRLNTRVRDLLKDGGRVAGVTAEIDGRSQEISARLGVVLACGDYSSGHEMKAEFVDQDLARVEGVNETSTGDGQHLGLSAGGRILNGDVMLGPEIRFVAPPTKTLIEAIPPIRPVGLFMRFALAHMPAWLLRPFLMMFVTTHLAPSHKLFEEGAILVNKAGERFVDESDGPQFVIPKQPDRIAFIVMDDAVGRKFKAWPYFISTAPGVAYAYLPDYRRNRRDIYASGRSIEDLAGKIAVPAEALRRTIDSYNASLPEGRAPIDKPPFHALGPAKSWIVITDGGLKINGQFEVLANDDRPIPGLYAAGSNGQGGVLLEGHGHHLGWALISGRLAGRSVGFGAWTDRRAEESADDAVPGSMVG